MAQDMHPKVGGGISRLYCGAPSVGTAHAAVYPAAAHPALPCTPLCVRSLHVPAHPAVRYPVLPCLRPRLLMPAPLTRRCPPHPALPHLCSAAAGCGHDRLLCPGRPGRLHVHPHAGEAVPAVLCCACCAGRDVSCSCCTCSPLPRPCAGPDVHVLELWRSFCESQSSPSASPCFPVPALAPACRAATCGAPPTSPLR